MREMPGSAAGGAATPEVETPVRTEPSPERVVEEQPSPPSVDGERLPEGVNLRRLAARGTLINSAFQIGLFGLGTLQRVLVAAWLTRAEYGLWGILLVALYSLVWIKSLGIADKYIQQSEPDQEAAFQKAFTLELGLSILFFIAVCLALPIFAAAYGHPEIIVPGVVLALAMPLTAFESPAWIAYRHLQYARQRLLTVTDPLTTFVVSITLAAAGLGYWGLIIGVLAGSVVGGLVCLVTCPYRMRLRFARGTMREYAHFSWPLVGNSLCGVACTQGMLLIANRTVGLAGIGAIGLAGTLTSMSDGVDAIVSETIYPVACAVADRVDALREAFVKSNRLALMWAMPAMVGVALFAGDLVHFVLGNRWAPAIELFAVIALTKGFEQVGFNWAIFLRAVNYTRPIFIGAALQVIVSLGATAPAMILFGLNGWAIGACAVTLLQILVRGYYMHRVLHGFSAFRQLLRSVLPVIPPVALVLLTRAVTGGDRSPAQAVLELALYCAAAIGATFLFERGLVMECIGYLRRTAGRQGFSVRSEASVQSA